MRQQTFILVSPYMEKNAGYSKFKNKWKFSWEESAAAEEVKVLSTEEINAIKSRHNKYVKPKK